MEAETKHKLIKNIVQFSLGLLCGYLILVAFNAYQTKIDSQNSKNPPVLETVVEY